MWPWGGNGGTGASTGAAAGTGGVGATGAGGSGATGAGGQGATGGGGDCPDNWPGESNETEITAYELDVLPIADCDGAGGVITGVIAGPDDVDWFYYRGDDTATCQVDPTVFFNTADPGLRICMFLECVAGATEFPACPDGSLSAVSPAGRQGCCSESGFTIDSFNCAGSADDDSYVYLRVDHPGASADTCDSYVLSYHF
jgi:hypothetical protein